MLTREKIVHVHVTGLCNLKCLHCYSSSGPQAHGHLPAEDLVKTTAQLRQFGYERVSFSGGEPALHPKFEWICVQLAAQGFRTSVITNGWKISKLERLVSRGALHSIAISFDGLRPTHDRIRGRKGSFDSALASVATMRSLSGSAGVVVSVSRLSMPEIPDLVATLIEAGANSVQLHPIAEVGRASQEQTLDLTELSSEALARVMLMAELLRASWTDVHFQCDITWGAGLMDYAAPSREELVTPLVITEKGTILPYIYDMNTAFELGNVGKSMARPLVNNILKRLLEDTRSTCAEPLATCFYPELGRLSNDAIYHKPARKF